MRLLYAINGLVMICDVLKINFLCVECLQKNVRLFTWNKMFNPFPPSVSIWYPLAKLLILILERIIKKISYERRDYESVGEKSLS